MMRTTLLLPIPSSTSPVPRLSSSSVLILGTDPLTPFLSDPSGDTSSMETYAWLPFAAPGLMRSGDCSVGWAPGASER